MGQDASSQVKEEYRIRNRRQNVAAVPLMALFFPLLVWAKEVNSHPVFAGAFAGYILVFAIFSRWNWRCPSCRGSLGRSINPEDCPRCGVTLR
jgi:hypothetical protein